MKFSRFFAGIGLLAAALSTPVVGQNYRPGQGISDQNPQPVKAVCYNSTLNAFEACPTSGGGSATPTGTAGAPNAAVVSVQGVPGGTAQTVTGTVTLGNGGQTIGTVNASTYGNTGHGTTDFNGPVKIGGKASSGVPTAVAAGQRVDAFYTVTGDAAVVMGVNQTPGTTGAVNIMPRAYNGSSSGPLATMSYIYDGTNGRPAPGDASGAYAQLSNISGVSRGQTILNGAALNSPGTGTQRALAVWTYLDNGTTSVPTPGDANGTYMVAKGATNLATAQVSVGATATLIAAARAGRGRLTITQNAAGPCFYGATSAVSATTGARLKVDGATKTYQYRGDLYGICPGGAVTVDTDEEF